MGATTFYLLEKEKQERERLKQEQLREIDNDLNSSDEQEEQVEAYEMFERSSLEQVKNDDLKARLKQLDVDVDAKATKKDLIDLLVGEEEPQEEGDDNEQGASEEVDTEGQTVEEEQEEKVEG